MTEAARDRLAQLRLETAAVIPAYREEKHISDIVRRTRQELDHVLVVDDGSEDKTATRAREAGGEVIVHSQNRGKGEAIKTGLRYWLDRQFVHVIILDADGQHLPEEIHRFLAAAGSAAERSFFLGNRMNNLTGMPFIRRVVNRYMSSRISHVCGQKIPDTQCGFRMLDRQLIPELLGGGDRFDYGVSLAGLPLKMMRFGFSASVSTSALACVVTTFRFKRTTCSCFNCSLSCLSVELMKVSAVPRTVSAPLARLSRFFTTFCKLSTSSFSESANGPSFGVNWLRSVFKLVTVTLRLSSKRFAFSNNGPAAAVICSIP